MAASLIFIPDISGFTQFVNNTEINHAQHIISELLETIIDSNQIGLEVSEIEGDAVLFYKNNNVPSIQEIISQTEKIFISFHEHLLKYETDRLCQCGACSTASGLSIKIIAHAGEIGFTEVKNNRKPFGPTLVEAHRLLKNDVPNNQYLLLSNNLGLAESKIKIDWGDFQSGISKQEVNDISYQYTTLAPLLRKVKPPPPPPPPFTIDNPITNSIKVDKPLYFVFEMLTNLDFRLTWNKGVNELEYDKNRTNRVGTKHRCVFNKGFADFETVKTDVGEDALVYGERLESVPFAKSLTFYYILTGDMNSTNVKVEIHNEDLPVIGFLLSPLIRSFSKKNSMKILTEFKQVTESQQELPFEMTINPEYHVIE